MTSADPDPVRPDVPQAPDGTATAWGAAASPAPTSATAPAAGRTTAGTDGALPTAALDPRLSAENPPTETPPGEASTTRDLAFREEKTPSRAWGTGSLATIAVVALAIVVFLVARVLDLL